MTEMTSSQLTGATDMDINGTVEVPLNSVIDLEEDSNSSSENNASDTETLYSTSGNSAVNDDDDDDDEDNEDHEGDPESEEEDDEDQTYNFNSLAFFKSTLSKLSQTQPPTPLPFPAHQAHYRNAINALLSDLESADRKLSTPPIPALEIEVLASSDFDTHGCGHHCPCDLPDDRNTAGNVFVIEASEDGVSEGDFLCGLRDFVYGEDDEGKYDVLKGKFVGGLRFVGYKYMLGGHSEIWAASRGGGRGRHGLPCVYIEVDGVLVRDSLKNQTNVTILGGLEGNV